MRKDMHKFDRTLVKSLKDGDKEAFNIIFMEYKDVIYYFCYNYLKDYDDANDCTQEIFLRLLQKIHLYNERESSFYTWFISLARNYILNFIKTKTNRMTKYTLSEESVEQTMTTNNTDVYLMLEDLEKILGKIKYSIYVNRVGFKMTFQEIAEMHNLNPETTRRMFNDANQIVKDYLKGKDN